MFNWTKHRFFVSCQAVKGEPMYGVGVVDKMVKAVLAGGAEGLRISQIDNVLSIMKNKPNVPVIAIIKENYPNSPIYITPTLHKLKLLVKSGVDVIAIDATLRTRPKESLDELVKYFFAHKQAHQLLMADCSDEADVLNAIKLKFDIIGTTMRGYTMATTGKSNIQNDHAFIKWCVEKVKPQHIKLIAEGGFNTPHDVKRALELGVDAVVVGSAITRPQFITKVFKDYLDQNKQ